MGIIKILPVEVYSKIKAGEVIERPASIISELIDNSIDAGASEIIIKIFDGGLKKITVIDNGSGISKDDLPLTLAMHATSKINAADDLFNIKTMGFRGEALYSIQTVSKVTITSNTDPKGLKEGYKISNAGESKNKSMPAASIKGTKVEVEEIFYNTPVRKKFLKSEQTEFSNIKKIVILKSFSYINISFKLFNGNDLVLSTDGSGDFQKAFISVFGNEEKFNINSFAKKINKDIKITLLHSSPENFFPTRKHQNLFVNKRPVTLPFFYPALDNGYRNYISPGRFPLVYLYIDINPELIDVNVHPAKKEIKFMNQEIIFSSIQNSVSEAMNKIIKRNIFQENNSTPQKDDSFINSSVNADKNYFNEVVFREKIFSFDQNVKNQIQNEYNILGIVFDTYIVIEKSNQVLFIDQHAACEAVIYKKKKEKYEQDKSVEKLIIPIIFELDKWNDNVKKKIKILSKNNIILEESEGQSLTLSEAPSVLLNNKNYDDVVDVLKDFLENEINFSEKNIIDSILIEASCKEAVKRGDKLTLIECAEIIDEYFKNDIKNCPHGRPSHFEVSKDYLEKIFQRKK